MYKKIYGGQRRDIRGENKCISDPRKNNYHTSPYPTTSGPYANQIQGTIKRNSQYIKTYFRTPKEKDTSNSKDFFAKNSDDDNYKNLESPVKNSNEEI
jgi:hypothetical protein